MRGSAMIQVTLTETAANKVKELIQRSDPETGQALGSLEDTYLRMYVAGGGCSGFRYGLALDRKIHEDDEVVQVHGLKVLVDGNSKEYLDGSNVDYAESVGMAALQPHRHAAGRVRRARPGRLVPVHPSQRSAVVV